MRTVFNEGHYTFASGFETQQDSFEQEAQARMLALIDSYGVVSGYGFYDDSVANNPSITISAGLAYDGNGRSVRLTNAQRQTGYSILTGLTTADVHKVMVVETALSGVNPEAHPITGELSYTKLVDYPVFSLVASGAVDTSKHVRIGRIFEVIEGASAHVGATTSDFGSVIARDTLSYPTTAPFVVVGPTGDPVADYTGNDAEPFNDAIAAVKSGSNGGVIVVRPGTYTIDVGTPVVADGLDSLKLIGMGKGTVIEGSGGTAFDEPKWQISNIGEFVFENMWVGDSEPIGSFMDVSDVEKFVFRDCKYGPGGGGAEYGVTFSGPVTWAKFEGNQIITSIDTDDSSLNFIGSAGDVTALVFRNNTVDYTDLWIDGTVTNLIMTNNDFLDSRISVGYRLSPTVFTRSQPKRTIIANNSFVNDITSAPFNMSIESAASGTIINANSFNNQGAEADIWMFTTATNSSDDSIISDNTFINTYGVSIAARQVEVDGKRVLVKGNTFQAEIVGFWYGLVLGAGSSNCLVDSNIFVNHLQDGIFDMGSSNWAGITDNTSNKEI